MRSKSAPLCVALIKMLVWAFISAIFGLVPLYSILLRTSYNTTISKWLNPAAINQKIIDEGILMLFCVAICGAVAIDVLFNKEFKNKWATVAVFIFGFVCLYIVSQVFTDLYFHSDEEKRQVDLKKLYNYDALWLIQLTLIIGTAVFCTIFKTFLFYKEELPSNTPKT